MECHYHPGRDSTDNCAICGKSICKECGLEIAGKIYCKDCLESIVGLSLNNNANKAEQPIQSEPARLDRQYEENIYEPQPQSNPVPPANETPANHEIKQIIDESPYNVRDNISFGTETGQSYVPEAEIPQQAEPQITQNTHEEEFIYPDHTYEPQPTNVRVGLEDKYEKYLDDLYFDEEEIPLNEQLAKDEEQFGSLTRKPYPPREGPAQKQNLIKQEQPKKPETPEEIEARLRSEILAEKNGKKPSTGNIHNINYKNDKEPMSAVDIILTIILVIVILIVIYYLIYIFILNVTYPTFMDAIYGLSNPQHVINNILHPPQ